MQYLYRCLFDLARPSTSPKTTHFPVNVPEVRNALIDPINSPMGAVDAYELDLFKNAENGGQYQRINSQAGCNSTKTFVVLYDFGTPEMNCQPLRHPNQPHIVNKSGGEAAQINVLEARLDVLGSQPNFLITNGHSAVSEFFSKLLLLHLNSHLTESLLDFVFVLLVG